MKTLVLFPTFQAGIKEKLSRLLFSGPKSGNKAELEKLKLEHLVFPFLLLAVGFVVSFTVFIAEICYVKFFK